MADTNPTTITTNDTAQEKAPEYHSELLSRLSNYTVVNSVFQQYNTLKATNSYLKAGLETAEGTTQKLVNLAQPVLQPVITKLDSALHLEENALKVLDKTEELGQNISTAYYQGVTSGEQLKSQIQTNAKDIVSKGIETVSHGKEVVSKSIESAKTIVQHTVESYANRPINQLLDVTEGYVNSILPAELELEPLDIHEEIPKDEQNEIPIEEKTSERLESNPLPRIKQLGGGVSKRVKRVALSKLQNVSFRSPTEVNAMGYVVDLIQYAADYIDYDQKKQTLKEVTGNVQQYFEEKKDQTVKLVSPAKEIIDKQTADVKEQAVKSVVSIVSSIAHATEVVRRQFIGQVPDVAQLQSNLADLTKRTKEAVLQLSEPQLSEYLSYVRSTYGQALESLIALTNAYTPALSSPLLSSVLGQLQSWQQSLITRLTHSYSAPQKSAEKEPVKEKKETQ